MWKRIRTISALIIALCLILCLNVLPVNADSSQINVGALPTQRSGPPIGFNPVTASDAALKEYGFPARPSDPTALQEWDNVMQHAKTYVKPVLSQSTTSVSPNGSGTGNTQAGYAVEENQKLGLSAFNSVYGQWVQTSQTAPISFVGYWVGLGGIDNGNLVQAGCASEIPSATVRANNLLSNYAFFAEFYNGNVWPLLNPIWVVQPIVQPEDEIYVNVQNYGGYSEAFLMDESSNQYTWVGFYTQGATCDSADYMFEPQYYYFSYIAPTQFSDCWFNNDSTGFGYFTNYPYVECDEYPYASPGLASNASFMLYCPGH
jgi:hypothetical protein